MKLEEIVTKEIVDLHRFFSDWYNGNCPNDDEFFSKKMTSRFDPEFKIVLTDGASLDLNGISQKIRQSYGSKDHFEIDIRNVRLLEENDDGFVTASYEEWQNEEGRHSTVKFSNKDKALRWTFVHEVSQ